MREVDSVPHAVEPPLQPSEVVPLTRATLPAVPLRLIGVASMKSGETKAAPVVPLACCTRKYWPGCKVTAGSSVD